MYAMTDKRSATKPLLDWRIAAGFTYQTELAQAAGLNVGTISAAENRHYVRRRTRLLIVAALNERLGPKGMQVELDQIDWGPEARERPPK